MALPNSKKIEMNVFNGTTYDILHPITEAEVIDYTKSGVLSTVGQVLSTTKDNMGNIVATATDIESRQHGMFIIARDTSVPASAFVSSSTYPDYPFRATINITGCQPYYVPDVYFDVDDISLGIFAPVSETGVGVVYIYASERPSSTIVIPTIKLATEASNLSTVKVLATVDVTKRPYKTVYKIGEEIDYSGMVVRAYYSNGANEQLDFYNFTITPALGTVFNTLGTENVIISYTENGVTKTASFTISVEPPVEIVPWSTGTDAQIAAMVAALDAGTLTIAQTGWSVGDERNVSLEAFQTYSSSLVSTSTQPSQTAKLVIMNQGGKILANNENCHFVVGFKDNVCKSYYDNDSNVYASSLLKIVENNVYNALPSAIKPIFKQWNVVTGTYNGTAAGGTNATTLQYFASPAEHEVLSERHYSTTNESDAVSQLSYFTAQTHRQHDYYGDYWWHRSPGYNFNYHACAIKKDGNTAGTYAVGAEIMGVSPIGCI